MGLGPSETSESQIAGDTSPEQGCMARCNYKQARDDNDIPGRDPAGPLAPLGGTESLLHSPPPKWERLHSQSQNLLCDLLLNLLPNLPLLESINLQLPRSGS